MRATYVLSHDPDARNPACDGEKASDVTGPSWPASTSSSLPVCIDHRKISNESSEPATTSSPDESSASDTNDNGLGVVNVLHSERIGPGTCQGSSERVAGGATASKRVRRRGNSKGGGGATARLGAGQWQGRAGE